MSDPLLSVTMTREAAEQFKRALFYADAVCENHADAARAPETVEKIREHGDWLRWGASRITFAMQEAA